MGTSHRYCPNNGACLVRTDEYHNAACSCHYRHITEGCSEWSCPWHGDVNMRESMKVRKACSVHKLATPVEDRAPWPNFQGEDGDTRYGG